MADSPACDEGSAPPLASSAGLAALVSRWALATPDATALHLQDHAISYAQLWQRVNAATAHLLAQGVTAGERVAWLGFNHPDLIALLMACARIGAIAVPLNLRLAAAELRPLLQHAGARWLFADEPLWALARAATADAGLALLPTAALCGALKEDHESATSFLSKGPAKERAEKPGEKLAEKQAEEQGADVPPHAGSAAPVLIVYTSGTTGSPKGAVYTQAQLLANAAAGRLAFELTAADRSLMPLPLFHVGGLNIQTLPVLGAGGCVVLQARFDAATWLADMARHRPSLSLLTPTMMRAVTEHPLWLQTDVSSLRFVNAGSSAVPLSMISAWHGRGVPVSQVYGATESGPLSLVLRPRDAQAHPGSTGTPAPGVQVRLLRADGQDAAPGQTGEVWLRAPQLASGYWQAPDDPAFADGWFHTGDLAMRDEAGFHTVTGRAKDMIISGGENVYPAELENLLADCPDIAESAVVGRADARWGEVPVAVVVPKPGATLDAARVLALFEGRLARYKHPRDVIIATALPKTAMGKVQKETLKRQLS